MRVSQTVVFYEVHKLHDEHSQIVCTMSCVCLSLSLSLSLSLCVCVCVYVCARMCLFAESGGYYEQGASLLLKNSIHSLSQKINAANDV